MEKRVFTDRQSVNQISERLVNDQLSVHTDEMVSRAQQAAQSRGQLIAIGRDLFTQQGYEATSLSQILDTAGMARGALYHHFPDGKQELFRAVVHEVDHGLHAGLETIAAKDYSPTERILAGFKLVLKLATNREFARIILVEAAVVFPGEWVEGSEYQLLRDTLAEAMEAGELRELPLDGTATVLYGAVRRAADHVAVAAKPRVAAREAEQALTALVDGLRLAKPAPKRKP